MTKVIKFANLIIGGAIFFCVVILLYCIYYWAHERSFTVSTDSILYCILPATLSSLLLISFRLKPSYRINLSIILVSAGVSIYIAEMVLTCFTPMLPSEGFAAAKSAAARIAKKTGVIFDARGRLDVIIDLEKRHIDSAPSIHPSNLLKKGMDGNLQSEIIIDGNELLPLGGIANKVTVFCNESGDYVMYESDEYGFHNPKGIWDASHIDIAALGDSYTQGECVPSNTNFVALIRKHYPATLNLGMAGNGPLAQLASLQEYLPSIKPKIVLWFYFEGNDLKDLLREKGSPLLMAYMKKSFTQSLLHRQAEIDQALTTFVETKRNAKLSERGVLAEDDTDTRGVLETIQAITKLSHVRQRLGLAYGRSAQDKPQVDIELALDLFGAILSQAKACVGAWDSILYFVYLPAWPRYANLERAKGAYLSSRDPVLALVRTIGLPVIDVHNVFQAHSNPLTLFPFRQNLHYNEEGHRLVAGEVLRTLSLVTQH
jgi:hypothetical protein